MEEDVDVKLIERRKLEAMRKRMKAAAPTVTRERTDREVVESMLYDRGGEVLEAAMSYFPQQTDRLVREIAGMVRDGRLKDKVSGGELFSIFRRLGLRFSLKTSIRVQDRGKLVDLSEKLATKKDE